MEPPAGYVKQSLTCLAVSPDGKYVLTGSYSGTVTLWDIKQNRLLSDIGELKECIRTVSFSVEGKFAAAYDGENVYQWDLITGKKIKLGEKLRNFIFNHTGSAGIGHQGAELVILDMATGKSRSVLETEDGSILNLEFAALSPDTAFCSWALTQDLYIANIGNGKIKHISLPSPVTSLVFSLNGKYLLTGHQNGFIAIWYIASGKMYKSWKAHTSHIALAGFYPNDKYVFSFSPLSDIVIWNISSGKELKKFDAKSSSVNAGAVAPDGSYFVWGTEDGTLFQLFTVTGEIRTFRDEDRAIKQIQISSDSNIVYYTDALGVCRLRDSKTGDILATYYLDSPVFSFSNNGNFHLCAEGISRTDKYQVFLHRNDTVMHALVYEGHHGKISALAFSPDDNYALSASEDYTMRLWDTKSKNCIRVFKEHNGGVITVAFSHDGNYILSGSRANLVQMWEVSTGNVAKVFSGHRGDVTAVSFSSDGRYLVSGSRDNSVKIWDIQSGKETMEFADFKNDISSVGFSPGGKYVFTTSLDATVRFCNTKSSGCVSIITGKAGTELADEWFCWTPDGKWAASSNGTELVSCLDGNELSTPDPGKRTGVLQCMGQ
ncbi:MAG: hypothetical protein JW904_00945 [Spirochaetales bacterium]|nr:hypothetical protein [Spirochaetales bacterium]